MENLKPENVPGHLFRKERISNFMKSRGVIDEQAHHEIIIQYAKSIRSNTRKFKIYKTICASKITFKIFKKWVDKKLNHK